MDRDSFVYGFFSALIFISFLLGSQYGDYFNFFKEDGLLIVPSFGEALNWKTLIIISVFLLVLYKNLVGSAYFKLKNALLFLIFAWSLTDILWIVKASFMGNYLFGSSELVFISDYMAGVGIIRNSILFFVSSFVALKMMRWSKQVFIVVGVWVLYWLFLFFGYPRPLGPNPIFVPFYGPIYYSMNFLPFMFGFKEWRNKTWKKLVFA